MPIQHRRGGYSYFRWRTGFSINEAQYPNIHVSWKFRLIYVALSRRFTWVIKPWSVERWQHPYG